MSLVKNRHLYSPKKITEDFYIYPPLIGGNIGETILSGIDQVHKNLGGDVEWLINGPFVLKKQTSTCGNEKIMLSEIEAISRKIGRAFSKAGLKKGHVVEFVIPNSTLYHVLVFGAWLCGATVSLGDPEMSLSALKTQLIDTKVRNTNYFFTF